MKKLILTSLATTALITQTSFAEYKLGSFGTVTPSISVASQKYSKGIVSNRNQPTGSIGAEYNSPYYFFLNASLNKETSDPTDGKSYDYEYCTTPGVKNTFGKVTAELSYENCTVSASETGYLQAKLGFEVNKEANINVNFYKESTAGAASVTGGKKIGGNNYEVEGTYNFGPFTGIAGYFVSERLLDSKHLGLSKNISGVDFDLSYYNVSTTGNRSYVSAAAAAGITNDHLILTIAKKF